MKNQITLTSNYCYPIYKIEDIEIVLNEGEEVIVEYPNGRCITYKIVSSGYKERFNDGQCHYDWEEFYVEEELFGLPLDLNIKTLLNECRVFLKRDIANEELQEHKEKLEKEERYRLEVEKLSKMTDGEIWSYKHKQAMDSMQKWVDDSNKRIEDYIKNSLEATEIRKALESQISEMSEE